MKQEPKRSHIGAGDAGSRSCPAGRRPQPARWFGRAVGARRAYRGISISAADRHRPTAVGITCATVTCFPQARTSALPEPKTETALALEGMWRVVVLNDPVNLMSYVVLVFRRVFGFDENRARKHMLEVHERGRSVVWVGPREKAEAYVYTLQEWHLSAVLEPDEAH